MEKPSQRSHPRWGLKAQVEFRQANAEDTCLGGDNAEGMATRRNGRCKCSEIRKVQSEAIRHGWHWATALLVEGSWADRMLKGPVIMPRCLNFIPQTTRATEVFKARAYHMLLRAQGDHDVHRSGINREA